MDISSYRTLKKYKVRENKGSMSSNRLAMQISLDGRFLSYLKLMILLLSWIV